MKSQKVLAGILAVLIFIYMCFRIRSDQPDRVDSIASILAYPLIRLQVTIASPLKRILNNWASSASMQLELQQLRIEKKELLAQLIKAQSTNLYYDQINELITYSDRYQQSDLFLSQVIQIIKTPKEYALLVYGGSYHGIESEMVAVYKNCIVGRVHTVFPFYSKVVTVYDPRCIIPAITVRSKSKGIYTGAATCGSLDYVSHLEQVWPNELVIANGEGVIFPYGFGIGNIVSVNQEAFHYVTSVRPFINPHELEFCYLMKKGASF